MPKSVRALNTSPAGTLVPRTIRIVLAPNRERDDAVTCPRIIVPQSDQSETKDGTW